MRDVTTPPAPDDFDERLRAAKAKRQAGGSGKRGSGKASMSGFGMAFRIGTELVAALAVGLVIGLSLDRWLDTAPWFLVVFFFLGAAAGILNVYRTASGLVSAAPDQEGSGDGNGDVS
ncbi:MAG: AtpZ/AtpI family protein [Rhodobacterales bacterium]|nr:AtpZ/AtpI family protein [Rhodobacterales bacterium]